jgi:hypothetical protein
MNKKGQFAVAFTIALASSLTLGIPALAGWATWLDDALRLGSQVGRYVGDDAVSSVRAVTGLADDIPISQVEQVRAANGQVITKLAVGSGVAAGAMYFVVDCENETALVYANQQQLEVAFDEAARRQCQ